MTQTRDNNGKDPFPAGQLPMRDISHSLPLALLKGREVIMAGFRAMLLDYDLTDQQWRVLRVLAEQPKLEVAELAQKCVIMQPSVSRILKRLVDRGLVQRATSAQDRRYSYISITETGKELFQEIAPKSEVLYKVITEKFGDEKMEDLLGLLQNLAETMGSKA